MWRLQMRCKREACTYPREETQLTSVISDIYRVDEVLARTFNMVRQ